MGVADHHVRAVKIDGVELGGVVRESGCVEITLDGC